MRQIFLLPTLYRKVKQLLSRGGLQASETCETFTAEMNGKLPQHKPHRIPVKCHRRWVHNLTTNHPKHRGKEQTDKPFSRMKENIPQLLCEHNATKSLEESTRKVITDQPH